VLLPQRRADTNGGAAAHAAGTAVDTQQNANPTDRNGTCSALAASVIVPSEWTRRQVLTRYEIPARRVHVARPGAEPGRWLAPARPRPPDLRRSPQPPQGTGTSSSRRSPPSPTGTGTACWPDRWTRDPDFVKHLQARITCLGYDHRVRLSGVLAGAALSHAYTTADLLVAPSRSETYGMTVTEALAHGVPVIASDVGGLPEAFGSTADGTGPGQLIPPGDPAALAAALGDWLGDEGHRRRLRAAVRQRQATLHGGSRPRRK